MRLRLRARIAAHAHFQQLIARDPHGMLGIYACQLTPETAAQGGFLGRLLGGIHKQSIDLVGQIKRNALAFALKVGDFQQHRFERFARQIGRHVSGIAQVRVDAEETARYDQHHQHVSERVYVPAELEAAMQRGDDNQAGAQIDVGRGPALQAAHTGAVAALTDTQQHEPHDQHRADGSQRIAEPGTSVRFQIDRGRLMPAIHADCRGTQQQRDLEIASVPELEDGLVLAHQ